MSAATVVVSDQIYTESGPVDGYLVVEGGRVADICAGGPPASLGALDRIDATGCRVIPGMIDLHIHGAGGWPVEGADVRHLQAMARYLAAFGTTAFLPTASARSEAELEATVVAVRDAMRTADAGGGARILGSHLEGSFLNPAQKGAMNPELFRRPSLAEAERLLALGAGTVRRITLAPELPGAIELIAWLAEQGVAVAGGHTDASCAETVQGIDAGVRIANHTYNAMRGLHHREPGALGAYLLDDRVLCEVICDFLHVHPVAVALLLRAAGHERIAIISDAIPAAGMPPGRYQMFGRDTHIDDQGYSKLANGTIAGSTRLMLDGVRNLVEELDVPLADACRMAALAPARVIGCADRKGSIASGKDADLVVIDQYWQVRWTLVEGRVVRKPGDAAPELNPAFLAGRV